MNTWAQRVEVSTLCLRKLGYAAVEKSDFAEDSKLLEMVQMLMKKMKKANCSNGGKKIEKNIFLPSLEQFGDFSKIRLPYCCIHMIKYLK